MSTGDDQQDEDRKPQVTGDAVDKRAADRIGSRVKIKNGLGRRESEQEFHRNRRKNAPGQGNENVIAAQGQEDDECEGHEQRQAIG